MTVSWKSWPNSFHICLFLCASGAVAQQFQLEPLNQSVLQGHDANFTATVEGVWQVMTWSLGTNLVLTFLFDGGTVRPPSDQYSATNCSSDGNCVVFTIHNVNRSLPGEVFCAVQTGFGTKRAQLYVQESGTVSIVGGNLTVQQDQEVELQCVTTAWFPAPDVSWSRNGEAVNSSLYNTTSVEDGDYFNSTSVLKFQAVSNTTVACEATIPALDNNSQSSSVFVVVVPKPTDWTVLIAVVVSFGSLALLVLLIIGIIFCCKRRKEKQPNYEDEMRRVRTQSQLSGVRPGQRQGQVNTGYEPDGQTSVAPSELTDSGFGQMPDVVNSVEAGNDYNSAHNTLDDFGFKKHRHVTIV